MRLAFYAELLPRLDFEERLGNALIVREPVGVVGAITPWNYPLHQAIAKVAAALAAGATVVHKPSGLAPLTAFVLAEAVEAAELPAGVYNLVTGSGEKIGGAMARHPGIDMISFTGSTSAGVNVGETAIQSVKRLALELGGKSASVVLEDANLQRAVTASVNNAFLNSGQTCDAWTRLIVPHDRLADVVDIALEAAARLRVGDPFDERTRLRPLVSQHQIEQGRWYVSAGISGGSRLVIGGPEPPPGRRSMVCR